MYGKEASLRPPADLKSLYDVILIDEMQDLSESQFSWACAHAVTKGNRVVCVGDPCQRLYSFRYAMDDVPRAMEEVCEMAGCAYTEFPLTNSFRFGPNIAEEANWLLHVSFVGSVHGHMSCTNLVAHVNLFSSAMLVFFWQVHADLTSPPHTHTHTRIHTM